MDRRPDERRRLETAKAWGASPSEFNGHVPPERHDHYAVDGTHTGWSIITREPMWTHQAQEQALALQALRDRLCGCGCGQKIDDTLIDVDDDLGDWDVHSRRCAAAAATEMVRRQLASPDGAPAELKPTDGLIVWATRPDPTPQAEEGGDK